MPAVIAEAGGLSALADYLTTARDVTTRCVGVSPITGNVVKMMLRSFSTLAGDLLFLLERFDARREPEHCPDRWWQRREGIASWYRHFISLIGRPYENYMQALWFWSTDKYFSRYRWRPRSRTQ